MCLPLRPLPYVLAVQLYRPVLKASVPLLSEKDYSLIMFLPVDSSSSKKAQIVLYPLPPLRALALQQSGGLLAAGAAVRAPVRTATRSGAAHPARAAKNRRMTTAL